MSSGETTITLYISLHLMKLATLSGDNLQSLLKDINYHIDVMKTLNNKNLLPYLLQWQETVSILIDKEQYTESQSNTENVSEGVSSHLGANQILQEGMFLNRALQAFWCGYAQRCNHYARKVIEMQSAGGQLNKLVILFVSMMNATRLTWHFFSF